MKNFFIHIGPHKTGTKTIQHLLKVDEDNMSKKNLYIPKTYRIWDIAGHHGIPWEMVGILSKDDNKFKAFISEIQNTSLDVLISAEHFRFALRYKKEFYSFLNIIKKNNFKIKFIFCRRTGNEYLKSIFFQLRKEKKIKYLDIFFFLKEIYKKGYFKDREQNIWYFDNEAFIKTWKNSFEDEMIVFNYDRKNIYNNFLKSIDRESSINSINIFKNKTKKKLFNPLWIMANVLLSVFGNFVSKKYN